MSPHTVRPLDWSLVRRLSGSGNLFARYMLGIPVHDCTGGYRCYRCQVLASIDLDAVQSRGYAFQVELTYRVFRKECSIVETPITFMDRRLGTSKMSRTIVLEAFAYVLRTRFSKQGASHMARDFSGIGALAAPASGIQDPASSASPTEVHVTGTQVHTSGAAAWEALPKGRSIPPAHAEGEASLPTNSPSDAKLGRGIRPIKLQRLDQPVQYASVREKEIYDHYAR